jgi:drug/metabolite transporter (DMT)-like permease
MGVWLPMVPVIVTFLCLIFKIEKGTKIRYIAMAIAFPYIILRICVKGFSKLTESGKDLMDYGEDPEDNWPFLYKLIVLFASAAAYIFNKKFLTSTKVSIVQFSFFAYVFAFLFTCLLFLGEQLIIFKGTLPYALFPLQNMSYAEEVSNVILFK